MTTNINSSGASTEAAIQVEAPIAIDQRTGRPPVYPSQATTTAEAVAEGQARAEVEESELIAQIRGFVGKRQHGPMWDEARGDRDTRAELTRIAADSSDPRASVASRALVRLDRQMYTVGRIAGNSGW